MCAYHRVNGAYACQNPDLLGTALKDDWGFHGFVGSDGSRRRTRSRRPTRA